MWFSSLEMSNGKEKQLDTVDAAVSAGPSAKEDDITSLISSLQDNITNIAKFTEHQLQVSHSLSLSHIYMLDGTSE